MRGGGNIKAAIEKAREVNMPKENIDRLIERFESRKQNMQNFLLEGYGSFGVPIMVEVETDNKNRILGEIRLIFKSFGGNLGEEGSVGFMFDRVGEIEVTKITEEAELLLIDFGATDFDENVIYSEVANLAILTKKVAELGMTVETSKIVMRPKTPTILQWET